MSDRISARKTSGALQKFKQHTIFPAEHTIVKDMRLIFSNSGHTSPTQLVNAIPHAPDRAGVRRINWNNASTSAFRIQIEHRNRIFARKVSDALRNPQQHTIFTVEYASQTCLGLVFAIFRHTSSHSWLSCPRHARLQAQENRVP